MKLILAIVQDKDSSTLGQALAQANVRATKLSTTGGFLREGNTTFMIGIEDDRVEEALTIISNNCQAREQFMTMTTPFDSTLDVPVPASSVPIPIQVGGATVFVLPIEAFYQF